MWFPVAVSRCGNLDYELLYPSWFLLCVTFAYLLSQKCLSVVCRLSSVRHRSEIGCTHIYFIMSVAHPIPSGVLQHMRRNSAAGLSKKKFTTWMERHFDVTSMATGAQPCFQFLGLWYYYPSTEKSDRFIRFGAVGYIITLNSSKSYVRSRGSVQISGRSGPPDPLSGCAHAWLWATHHQYRYKRHWVCVYVKGPLVKYS